MIKASIHLKNQTQMMNFVSSSSEYYNPIRTCTRSAGCECEYSVFPVGKGLRWESEQLLEVPPGRTMETRAGATVEVESTDYSTHTPAQCTSQGLSTSTEEETLDPTSPLTAKRLNLDYMLRPYQGGVRETSPKAYEGMPVITYARIGYVVTNYSQQGPRGGAAESKSSSLRHRKLAEENMALAFVNVRSRARGFCRLQGKLSLGREVFGGGVPWLEVRPEAWMELHEKKLLTVPAAPGHLEYNHMHMRKLVAANRVDEIVRADSYMHSELTRIPHSCKNGGVPIFACPRDILNPFALEKEIPLKESLEAHAIRLAKKKGVNGSQYELLGKLEEAGNAAYQVGSSERSRCHSI
ncbi:hypothetical protein Tco_0453959 [Tanacetum coccineum]